MATPSSTPAPLAGWDLPDVNYGPKLVAATAVVTMMALISVILRMWVRAGIIKSMGWDDRFIVLAMTVSLICFGLVVPQAYYGAGRHAYYIPPAKESQGLYINFISQPFFLVGVMLVKVSIGLFLLRLTPSQFYHRFIWCMQAFMVIYSTVALITILTQCRPLTVIWDPSVKNAVCFSPLGLRACAYFNAACSIIADLVFALLPIGILWNVKINARVKLALVFILSLGVFALISCIVKVYYLSFYGKFNDFLWDSVNITIWTACELNIGIFAASIATLRPLFRSAFQGGSTAFSTGGFTDNEKHQNSLDKNGFVKHISNSRGTSKIGGSQSSKSDGFEMYGSVITANDRSTMTEDNESEETILPMQMPQPMAIRKTTEVSVDEMQMKRPIEDQV
ncbi:hypothetical protein V8E51_003792 [Hyaloscypha variabilis]